MPTYRLNVLTWTGRRPHRQPWLGCTRRRRRRLRRAGLVSASGSKLVGTPGSTRIDRTTMFQSQNITDKYLLVGTQTNKRACAHTYLSCIIL